MNQLEFRPIKHIKMTVWTSVFWKITIQLAKERPEMVVKKPFTSILHFYSDYRQYVSYLFFLTPKYKVHFLFPYSSTSTVLLWYSTPLYHCWHWPFWIFWHTRLSSKAWNIWFPNHKPSVTHRKDPQTMMYNNKNNHHSMSKKSSVFTGDYLHFT